MVSDKCLMVLLAELKPMMVLDENTKTSSDLNELQEKNYCY